MDATCSSAHAASGCWCSTWTACSPTAASTCRATGEELKVFHVRDGSGLVARAARRRHQSRSSPDAAPPPVRPARRGTRHSPRAPGRDRQGRGARRALRRARHRARARSPVSATTRRTCPMLRRAGLAIAVADAHAGRAAAPRDWVTKAPGRSRRGEGSMRPVAARTRSPDPARWSHGRGPRRALALLVGLLCGRDGDDVDIGRGRGAARLLPDGRDADRDGRRRTAASRRARPRTSSSSSRTTACVLPDARTRLHGRTQRRLERDRGSRPHAARPQLAAAVGRRAVTLEPAAASRRSGRPSSVTDQLTYDTASRTSSRRRSPSRSASARTNCGDAACVSI